MNLRCFVLLLTLVASTLVATARDTINWDSAKADMTPQGLLTVEVTVTVHLDNSTGRVSLFLQDKDDKALGNPWEANVTAAKGDSTLTLKRAIPIPKGLALVNVCTPVYVGDATRTGLVSIGTLNIGWASGKPSVTVTMPRGISVAR